MNHGCLTTLKRRGLIPNFGARILARNRHGLPRRTVERREGPAWCYRPEGGPKRSAKAGHAIGAQRHPVGLSHRCAMEGPSRAVSSIPDLPSVFPAMVQGWCLGQGVVPFGRGPARPREDRHHRMLLGWHLRKCQKRGRDIGPTKRGKGTKVMVLTDAHGLPIAVRTFSARPNEVTLADRTIRKSAVKPRRVIADRAYDSDKLRRTLSKRGIRLICPHRRNRTKAPTQDGRTLRRYCRRWKVERLFSWLFNWRRTVVRYDYHAENYLGFVQLACFIILSRHLF